MWSADGWFAYEEFLRGTSDEEYERIDEEVQGRPCSGCESGRHDADIPDVELTEQDELRLVALIPAGNPDTWSADEWAEWQHTKSKLLSLQEQVRFEELTMELMDDDPEQCVILEFDDDAPKIDVKDLLMKPISEMTDAEWAAFDALSDDDVMKYWQDVDMPSKPESSDKPQNPPKGSPCNCEGPGSKEQRWTTHLPRCPQHEHYDPNKPYQTGTTTSGCGSGHNRDKKFKLEDGLEILATAYRDVKFIDSDEFDVGVYMYDSWQWGPTVSPGLSVPWQTALKNKQVILEWPDFGVPKDSNPMVDVVRWMLDEMTKGVRFETGCMGGHGRTGTMLALLLVAQGITPGQAIKRVREDHCKNAVENRKQADYVAEFWKMWHGNTSWRKSKKERKLFEKVAEEGHKNYSSSSSTWKSSVSGTYDSKNQVWYCPSYINGYTWNKERKRYESKTKGGG